MGRLIHATCVSLSGHGLLIQGKSGSGKSNLALQLIALGCDLVADDQTLIEIQNEQLSASAPAPIKGQIEARGVGILACQTVDRTAVKAIVDLDQTEDDRLPPLRMTQLDGCDLALFHKSVHCHFPSALFLYLSGERVT
ncbi:HPr kinase/phosphorylase [Algirhabdus cladophorae]|uniref:HPr kinase/phosphorylase n=1 Tax=Algirhabdus cladophorae TaxID=3377108 RepID=UPI003B846F72